MRRPVGAGGRSVGNLIGRGDATDASSVNATTMITEADVAHDVPWRIELRGSQRSLYADGSHGRRCRKDWDASQVFCRSGASRL